MLAASPTKYRQTPTTKTSSFDSPVKSHYHHKQHHPQPPHYPKHKQDQPHDDNVHHHHHHHHHPQQLHHNRRFLSSPSSMVSPSDIADVAWEEIESTMLQKRSECAAVTVEGRYVVVIGGQKDGVSSGELMYDLHTKDWKALPPMKIPRNGCSAAVIDNKVYVFGGFYEKQTEATSSSMSDDDSSHSVHVVLDSVEVLDLKSHVWSFAASMPTPRTGCAAVALPESRQIMVLGGFDGNQELSIVETYQTESNSWKSLASMNACRSGCAAVAIPDRREVVVMGGFDGSPLGALDTVESFSINTQQWKPLNAMLSKRYECAAVSWKDKIVVMGGHNGVHSLNTTELFSFGNGEWHELQPMTTERIGCAGAIAGKRVLAIGGFHGVEEYDLDTVEELLLCEEEQELPTPAAQQTANDEEVMAHTTTVLNAVLIEPEQQQQQQQQQPPQPKNYARLAPMMPNLMMKPSPQSTSSMASSSEVAYLEQLRNFQETEIEILRRKDAHLERMHAVQTQELMSLREKNVLYEKRIGELEEQVQQLLQAFPRLNGSNSAASNAASMSGDAAAMDHGEM